MKKFISVTLAIIMLISVLTVAIPVSATAAPIEATPLTDWTKIGWNYTAVSRTEVTPLGFTTAQGLYIAPANGNLENFNMSATNIYGAIQLNEDVAFGSTTHIIVYVDIPAANTLMPVVYVNAAKSYEPEMALGVGDTYYYAALGDDTWTEATTVSGKVIVDGETGAQTTDNTYWGAMKFDSAFKGYIKFAVSDLTNDTVPFNSETQLISNLATRFVGVGGIYGNPTVGPYFLVTNDSTSTKINVPDEYKTAPIEATPITNWTRTTSNTSTVTATEVIPVSTINAKGINMQAANGATENANLASTQIYANLRTNEAVSFVNATHIIVYIKTTAANIVLPTLETNANKSWTPCMALAVGDKYQYASLGDDTWSTGTAVEGNAGSAYYGAIQFNSAFEGYVKFAISDLTNDTVKTVDTENHTIAGLVTKVKGLGGDYGSVVAGPYFLVTSDSNSTQIAVPDEYKPAPIEATPITDGTRVNYNSSYVTATDVIPLEKLTSVDGIKLSPSNSALSYDAKGLYNSKAIANYLFKEQPNAETGTYYTLPDTFLSNGIFMLYVKTNSANAILPTIHFGKKSGSYNLTYSLGVNKNYSYAAIGDDSWTESTVEFTGLGATSTRTDYGVIQFDSAFEGFIKIPVSSLIPPEGGAINAIGRIEVKFANVGGEAGDVVAGPFFFVTADSPSTEINIPDEYKPAPLAINNIEIGSVRAREYNFTADKVDNGYRLNIDEGVQSETETKWVKGQTDKWTYVENEYTGSNANANLVLKPALPLAPKDIDGFLVYVKFDSANEFALTLDYEYGTHWNNSWNPSISLKPGKTVKVLAAGSEDWQDVTIEQGSTNSLIWGKVSFDSAFEGYIKIPYTSLDSDNSWKPYTTADKGAIDRIIQFQLHFKGIGGSIYGDVVTDLVGFYTSDSPLVTFTKTEAVYETGDVNNDCFVNVNDLTQLRKYLLGIAAEASVKYANVNGDVDGAVNILDLIRLKKTLVGA